MAAGVVLLTFFAIAVVDSVHFRPLLPAAPGAAAQAGPAYSTKTLSLLDAWLSAPRESVEKTYSTPLATHQFSKESIVVDGRSVRDFPRLQFGGSHLKDAQAEWAADVAGKTVAGLLYGLSGALLLWLAVAVLRGARTPVALRRSLADMWQQRTDIPWKAILITASIMALLVGWVTALWPHYHVLGTDQTGNDVLFQAIKSIRTAVVIGSLATLATLPLAILFGILAGYYKGRIDDGIQYLYTVLSSIPSVLLISAFVLMIQVFIDKNPNLFETGLEHNWPACCALRR
jgi:peptide/nickel transport system permease protein